MSALSTDAVILAPAGGRRARAARREASAAERPLVRLAAFAALGLYGTLRWAALLSPAPVWRLLGLLALAVALAALGSALAARGGVGARRGRLLALAAVAVAALAALAVAGVPLSWIRHVRIARTASGIGDGLAALPRALVPYAGINAWLRVVIVLGAGVLLLDAAALHALAPRRPSDLRRAAIALPLVALAVVPSTLERPSLAYAHGLLLFALLAAFMWGDRLRRGDAAVALSLTALAGAGAMIAAPALDRHRPWLDYEALAGELAPAHPVSFDWTQRYGPLRWPRTGHEVFDVQAAHPDYWKTENLDVFDGRRWAQSSSQPAPLAPASATSPAALARWTQTLHVTLRGMRSNEVVAAGFATQPSHAGQVLPGSSEGTWSSPTGLAPGDSYTVAVYSPHPSAAQLRLAGAGYPRQLLARDLSVWLAPDPPGMAVPQGAGSWPAAEAYLPPFGSRRPMPAAVRASVDAPAAALARRLERHARTPYDYVVAVKRFLSRGFTYDERTPASDHPLETFLFQTHRGYCQQFAGAMALLLRLGGVPARVATGFTTGTYDGVTHSWVVSDLDAHAWVEAWFPRYGWVRFDPTPAAAPELGGRVPLPAIKSAPAPAQASAGTSSARVSPDKGVGQAPRQLRHGGGTRLGAIVLLGLLGVALAAALAATIRLREPSADARLAELERALARAGRPLAPGSTLVSIERRLRAWPQAQRYVRALRLARFAGAPGAAAAADRRALRAALRDGLGLTGRIRALWALPPRITLRRSASNRSGQGINST